MPGKIALMLFGVLMSGGLFVQALHCQAAEQPPLEGEILPEITLPIPDEPKEREYLGLNGKGTFKIPKIKADVVIVEVFSMYCPFCQKEAPNVNALYRIIDENEDLKQRIKIVGIGAGNSAFEVNTFRSAYGIRFPLFADMDFTIHEAMGKVRTPYFVVIKIDKNGSHKIIYSKVGSIGDARSFMQFVAKESGLTKGM